MDFETFIMSCDFLLRRLQKCFKFCLLVFEQYGWVIWQGDTLERFSKHDATSKTTWKWRGNGVATSISGNMTPYPRHFHVVFDVASCLLNLSTTGRLLYLPNSLCSPCKSQHNTNNGNMKSLYYSGQNFVSVFSGGALSSIKKLSSVW